MQTSNRCGGDAGSPGDGRGSAQGALSPPDAERPLPPPETRCLLQLVGARPGRDGCPWRALDFRSRRSSLRALQGPRLHARSRLPPPSPLRWHRYLFRAASPNDSWGPSRAAPRRFPAPGGGACVRGRFFIEPLKLFTKFLEDQDKKGPADPTPLLPTTSGELYPRVFWGVGGRRSQIYFQGVSSRKKLQLSLNERCPRLVLV